MPSIARFVFATLVCVAFCGSASHSQESLQPVLSTQEYIARIDADDIALPQRLERQVGFLEQNPQVALVGSSLNNVDVSGRHLATWLLPTADREIRERLFGLRDLPLCHVALVFRTEVFRAVNAYRSAFLHAEDYDFWLRIAERWQVANLPEPLVNVRRRAHSVSSVNTRQQVISSLGAWAASAIRRAGGRDPIDQEEPVTRELLTSMGVSDAVFEEHLIGVYLYWIDVMLQSSDGAGALRVMREALESQPWRHISKSLLANTWLAAARIYSRQGRYLRSVKAIARAIATRPVVAGRPIKRIAGRLRLFNNGAALPEN